jgi:hypothetical protein
MLSFVGAHQWKSGGLAAELLERLRKSSRGGGVLVFVVVWFISGLFEFHHMIRDGG